MNVWSFQRRRVVFQVELGSKLACFVIGPSSGSLSFLLLSSESRRPFDA